MHFLVSLADGQERMRSLGDFLWLELVLWEFTSVF